jgi:hypothetical protein
MKRLVTLLLLFLPLMMTAQEIMIKHRQKADPLTGDCALTYWESRHVMLSKTDDGKFYLSINHPKHVFVSGETKIGFYTAKGQLIMASGDWSSTIETGSVTRWLRGGETSDSTEYCREPQEFLFSSGPSYEMQAQREGKYVVEPQHIYKFLTETNGYIRIVSPTYYGEYFDVKARLQKK